MDRLRAEEEDLREQQRKKLEMFQLMQEQEEQVALHQEEEMEDMKQQMLLEQQQRQNFVGTSWADSNLGPKKSESPGVAFASITIENVDNAHDYEVTDNGIVRLRRPQQSAVSPEYEYEYYEADPDDIQFPVGGDQTIL